MISDVTFVRGVLNFIVSDVNKFFACIFKAVSFKYTPRDTNKANFRKFFSIIL